MTIMYVDSDNVLFSFHLVVLCSWSWRTVKQQLNRLSCNYCALKRVVVPRATPKIVSKPGMTYCIATDIFHESQVKSIVFTFQYFAFFYCLTTYGHSSWLRPQTNQLSSSSFIVSSVFRHRDSKHSGGWWKCMP